MSSGISNISSLPAVASSSPPGVVSVSQTQTKENNTHVIANNPSGEPQDFDPEGARSSKEREKTFSMYTETTDEVVFADATVVPQAPTKKRLSQKLCFVSCYLWSAIAILAAGLACLVVFVLVPGIREGKSVQVDEEDIYDRQGYYESLMGILDSSQFELNSPQGQAIQWLAFEDIPLALEDDSDVDRVWQRFALVAVYFAQGGPKLWSSFNRDESSGWIEHGAGIHECDWKGIDCNADMQIVGVRLGASGAPGITLTGTIASELSLLTELRHLDLSKNRLEGTIPDEWEKLTNLCE